MHYPATLALARQAVRGHPLDPQDRREPVIDRREPIVDFGIEALTVPQTSKACGGTQLPYFCILMSRNFDGFEKTHFSIVHIRRVAGQQKFTIQAKHFCLVFVLAWRRRSYLALAA
jgi:hypothetical protein